MKLFAVEVRRALHRRLVWTLLLIALLGIAVMAIIAFVDSGRIDVAAMHARGEPHPAVMANWWVEGGGDGVLMIGAFFLAMGGLIGGASVVGAEWRAGTMTTLLTWEPRRLRLLVARIGSATVCAIVIATVLQLVLLAALLPAVFAHGTTAGADRAWAVGLAAGLARIALITGLATMLGASIASIARNTAGAIVAVWVWLSVVERLVAGLRPKLSGYLLGESIARVLTWADLERAPTSRSPGFALALLALYSGALLAAAAVHLQRSDVAAS